MNSNKSHVKTTLNLSEWSEKAVKDIAEIVGGGTPSTKISEYWNGNIPWITPKDLSMQQRKYICKGLRNITIDGLNKSSAKIIPPNSIILSTRAPIGYIAISKRDITTNQGCHSLIPSDRTDTEFLYYLILNNVNYLKSQSNGSTFGELSAKVLSELEFALPNLKEQKAIAKILSDLDSKIELNERMNKTLEDIAQAIFKHWFIDFEFPNEEGKPYRSSGGEMVDSELGKIPKGWKISCLGAEGTLKNGVNYLREDRGDTELYIINVRNIANSRLLLKYNLDRINIDYDKAKNYFLKENDIIIARSGIPGEASLVVGNLEDVIYSGFSIRYRLNIPTNRYYVFSSLQRLKKHLSNYSIGTSLESINQETLKNMKFIIPSHNLLERFNRISLKILERIYNNIIENYSLINIRDLLLPKLMTGKIRVPLEDEHE